MRYGMLVVISQRSKEYLKIMKENGFIPSCAILINGIDTLEEKTLKTGERLFDTTRFAPCHIIISSVKLNIFWKK